MKKVLLLGGSRFLFPVIEAIHSLGYYAITCDYLPNNPAHSRSNEYHDVSIIDKDKVLALAEDLKINGIMSFACDPGVETAAYVAEKLSLPSVGSFEAVTILQNKAKFRNFLYENGFNVPKAKGYRSIMEAQNDASFFQWPVIVKPVDAAGSKGVARVDHSDYLGAAVKNALQFSRTKSFIIEEFIEKVGHSSDTDCFSVEGNLIFTSFCNQMFDEKAENPYVPSAYSWPSTMPNEIQMELQSELQRLISLLKLNTSIYNIETRQGVDGKAYIMEVSPRGGGNRLAEMLHYATGVDLVTNAVRASVGDELVGITGNPGYDGCWAEIILHADQQGVFDELWIDESIKLCVIERDLWIQPGDTVSGFTGANAAIGTLALRFDTNKQLEEVMSDLSKYVRVTTK